MIPTAATLPNLDRLTVRWTIGAVRPRGWELLRISVWSAFRLFGPCPRYVICVNTLPLVEAQALTGALPAGVSWRKVTRADVPEVLRGAMGEDLIEGMGWKLAPLRTWPERYELALDNDVVLWDVPAAMRDWLASDRGSLLAEDVDRCLGSFDALCPPGCFNAGIRGLLPGEDLSRQLAAVLADAAALQGGTLTLSGEIEEQGLQVAALCQVTPQFLVRNDEVSLCSPFWPKRPELGSCGAHFIGLNAAHIPWNYYNRPADVWLDEHWARWRPEMYARAGLSDALA